MSSPRTRCNSRVTFATTPFRSTSRNSAPSDDDDRPDPAFDDENGLPTQGYDPKLANAISMTNFDEGIPTMWPQFESLGVALGRELEAVEPALERVSDRLGRDLTPEFARQHPDKREHLRALLQEPVLARRGPQLGEQCTGRTGFLGCTEVAADSPYLELAPKFQCGCDGSNAGQ